MQTNTTNAAVVIDRFEAAHERRGRSAALCEARKAKDAIAALLGLLAELDDLTPDEPDRSAFGEAAALFRDIGEIAAQGARAARRAGGGAK